MAACCRKPACRLAPDPDTWPESGFGWFLIGHLTRSLVCFRENDRNFVAFHPGPKCPDAVTRVTFPSPFLAKPGHGGYIGAFTAGGPMTIQTPYYLMDMAALRRNMDIVARLRIQGGARFWR